VHPGHALLPASGIGWWWNGCQGTRAEPGRTAVGQSEGQPSWTMWPARGWVRSSPRTGRGSSGPARWHLPCSFLRHCGLSVAGRPPIVFVWESGTMTDDEVVNATQALVAAGEYLDQLPGVPGARLSGGGVFQGNRRIYARGSPEHLEARSAGLVER